MNRKHGCRVRVRSFAVVLVMLLTALQGCSYEEQGHQGGTADRYAPVPIEGSLFSVEEQGDQGGTADRYAPVPIEGPLFSVSEGGEPIPFVVNVAQAGVILENGTSIVFNYNEALGIAFDTLGQVQFLTGRRGEGPGEFRGGIGNILPIGGGFGAWDSRSRRYSFFDDRGEFTQDLSLLDWSVVQPIGWMDDVGLIFTEYAFEPGAPRKFFVVDTLGSAPLELLGPPAPPRYSLRFATGERTFAQIGIGSECTPTLLPAVIGGEFYVAESATGSIHRYLSGGLSEIVYTESNRRALTNEMLEQVKAKYLDVPVDTVMTYVRAIGTAGDPLPTWSAVLTDESLGVLLLRETRCGEDLARESTWTVVSRAGEVIGRIVVPPSTMVHAARHGRLLMVRRDELGVEFAELYNLPDQLVGRIP